MDVKNSFNPDDVESFGGIVVYFDESNHFLIEEYLDTATPTPQANTYPWIRLVRSFNTYSAYWSEDGVAWNFMGAGEMSGVPKIGLFIKGVEGTQPLSVDYIRIITRNYIEVNNLVGGVRVDLVDSAGVIQESKVCGNYFSSVRFYMDGYLNFPYQGNFVITLPNGNKYQTSGSIDLYKGDVYQFEVHPDLYYREVADDGTFTDILLYPNQERFLGYWAGGVSASRDILMIARNSMLSGYFKDVTFEITSGADKVQIAPDLNGAPGTFSSIITVPQIDPGTEYRFWARLSRGNIADVYNYLLDFNLAVSSQYL